MQNIEVSDIALAAFLAVRGFPVLHMNGRPGRRVFAFPHEARDECRAYFAGAKIEAKALAESMRSIKAMIHHADTVQ